MNIGRQSSATVPDRCSRSGGGDVINQPPHPVDVIRTGAVVGASSGLGSFPPPTTSHLHLVLKELPVFDFGQADSALGVVWLGQSVTNIELSPQRGVVACKPAPSHQSAHIGKASYM